MQLTILIIFAEIKNIIHGLKHDTIVVSCY